MGLGRVHYNHTHDLSLIHDGGCSWSFWEYKFVFFLGG